MNIKRITIKNKVAIDENPELKIVCNNSTYRVEFHFDAEWDKHDVKTARFVYNGMVVDVPFAGTSCKMPPLSNARMCEIGVYAGDIQTSTPALVSCNKSILDETGLPPPPADDVYNQIVELCGEAVETANDIEKRANSGEFDGDTPERGVDYWTPEDVAAITKYIDDAVEEASGTATDGRVDTIEKVVDNAFLVDLGFTQSGSDVVSKKVKFNNPVSVDADEFGWTVFVELHDAKGEIVGISSRWMRDVQSCLQSALKNTWGVPETLRVWVDSKSGEKIDLEEVNSKFKYWDNIPCDNAELTERVANLETQVNTRLCIIESVLPEVDERVANLETQMGDIDSALDAIIAIQNQLIGGEG